MSPNNIGGNYGPNPYGNYGVPHNYQGGPTGPGQMGSPNPYAMMGFFSMLLKVMAQLQSGWQGYMNPQPRPAPFPQPPHYGGGPVEPPIQALYGVAIGPRPQPRPEPPIQALYGVAIGPRPFPNPEPPIQALYGVAIGPGAGGPPIQALYGVAIG